MAVPQLRIIDDELWGQVKSRQLTVRTLTSGRQTEFKQARRPKFLFSGLAKCSECGGGYVMFWRDPSNTRTADSEQRTRFAS